MTYNDVLQELLDKAANGTATKEDIKLIEVLLAHGREKREQERLESDQQFKHFVEQQRLADERVNFDEEMKLKETELEQVEEDRKKRRIMDWVKWAVGGICLGGVTWATMYYEENSIATGTKGRLLGKIVDKTINRRM